MHPTVATFPDHVVHPGVRYVPISDLPAWESVLVWRRRDAGPRVRAFVEVAQRLDGGLVVQ